MKRNAHAMCFAIFVGVAVTPAADACKYSVRDIGFVHNANSSYHLVLVVDDEPSAARRAEMDGIVRKSLADANVSFSVLIPMRARAHPLLKGKAALSPGLWAIHPGGASAPIALPAPDDPASWVPLFDAFVDSPARREIARHLTIGLGVVVVLEGIDPASNLKARAAAELAVRQITEVLAKLEKPAKSGPAVVIVQADDSERWLRWGLGESPDAPSKTASVAVVFGQFRRAGKVFNEPDLVPNKLFSQLAVLGFSCECNLDRSALFGPALPHRWDIHSRRLGAELGFDPSDPKVRAEINAILAKAPLIEAGEFSVTYDQLRLGFKETPLDEDDAPMPPAPAATRRTNETTPPAAGPEAREIGGPSKMQITGAIAVFSIAAIAGRFLWRKASA